MKTYIQLKEKLKIVNEAYRREKNIRLTAKKHNIHPCQIRAWEKQLDEIMNREGMSEDKRNHILSLKSTQP